MDKIKLSEFTFEKIKNREFEKVIPELYELENVIENNPWHNNDPVFHHIVSVTSELEDLLKDVNNKIKNFLNQKVTNHFRKELLFLATVFHDIAKKETFTIDNNMTETVGHEEMGSEKLKNIVSRFDLSKDEIESISRIVKNHKFIHDISNLPIEEANERWERFKKENSDIFLELILLGKADMLGSQLKNNMPEEFEFRLGFIDKIIDSY